MESSEKAFVIIRECPTGFAFPNPRVICVFEGTRKEANLFVKEKNKNSKRCGYYLTTVKREKTGE